MNGLQTKAERSGWQETSRYADVVEFLDALKASGLPHVDRIDVQAFGKSEDGRDLLLVRVTNKPFASDVDAAAGQKIRVLVNANIHAGEVEGKEAVMILLREFASGEHAKMLENCVLWFVPIYNIDGNEKVDRRNRLQQNGPDAGVGERFNAKGLDLNRDFVKAESSECRAMLGLFKRLDPHVFMDLHTTNGSAHGYQLTYAPSLSPNVDPTIDEFTRKTLLTTVRGRVDSEHGFKTYDYGNFPRGRGQLRWTTYDHRPRFGTNYYALRNRIAVLSEAFSYVSFERRVQVTRAFVLETLRAVSENADKIWDLCVQADNRLESDKEWEFGYDTGFAEPIEDEVLVGRLDRRKIEGIDAHCRVQTDEVEKVKMEVRVAFAAKAKVAAPAGWAIRSPKPELIALLDLHGIRHEQLKSASEREVEVFEIEAVRFEQRSQGHRPTTVEGKYSTKTVTLPEGTLIVPAKQRLARVAAQLLEPVSEDSATTWSAFTGQLLRGEQHPVVRLR